MGKTAQLLTVDEFSRVVDPSLCCELVVHVLARDLPPAQFGPADVLRDPAVLPGFEARVEGLFED